MFGNIRVIGIIILVTIASVACQTKPVVISPPAKPVVTHAPKKEVVPKVVDTKAQQLSYDQGIHAYSMEKYEEAKVAFQRVIEIDSKNELGLKARENLKKVVKVLKTVEEIEAK